MIIDDEGLRGVQLQQNALGDGARGQITAYYYKCLYLKCFYFEQITIGSIALNPIKWHCDDWMGKGGN